MLASVVATLQHPICFRRSLPSHPKLSTFSDIGPTVGIFLYRGRMPTFVLSRVAKSNASIKTSRFIFCIAKPTNGNGNSRIIVERAIPIGHIAGEPMNDDLYLYDVNIPQIRDPQT